jgi:hypothetical protein
MKAFFIFIMPYLPILKYKNLPFLNSSVTIHAYAVRLLTLKLSFSTTQCSNANYPSCTSICNVAAQRYITSKVIKFFCRFLLISALKTTAFNKEEEL